ncbi:MAG: Hsp70 family protein [Candidatus Korobacteraceae bacterium]
MNRSSRYLLGIDLGTTNSVVAYIDTSDTPSEASAKIRVFDVAQVVAPGEVRTEPALPSFLYFPTENEIDSGAFDLPWEERPSAIAGVAARDHGMLVPGRLVSSAKSWLCQDAVDRTAEILPRDAEPPEPMISPIEASARYLMHLRNAWNHAIFADKGSAPEVRFENQQIVLTVPASFDEEARELTVEAARRAGLEHLTLLEEPLAAFYAWVASHRQTIATHVEDGDLVLICDIGGGTSDFSLVRAQVSGSDVQFERTAIGEHLLLGGENLDLALARRVEQRLNTRLSLRQRHSLAIACRAAKEGLLGNANLDRLPISILGSGRAVVGQMLQSELTRDEVLELLMSGFLPLTAPEETPKRSRSAGLREVGLPYASDPAITKHLAAFLRQAGAAMNGQSGAASGKALRLSMVRPDAVLFNGGFCIPAAARERIVEAIASWFGVRESGWAPRVLRSDAMGSAVAVGAAYYGRVRRGEGLRVKAGSARTYYIGTRTEGAAVCVLPAGTDEGTTLQLNREFSVLANRPVSFNLFSSTVGHDPHGALAELDPAQVHRHAPLVTLLRYGKKLQVMDLAVRLSVSFTEVGTLELWCQSVISPHRWRLQFELRGNAPSDDTYVDSTPHAGIAPSSPEISEDSLRAAKAAIQAAFTRQGDPSAHASLVSGLEAGIGLKKESWPMPLLRVLCDVLLEVADGRKLSAPHEARWLNLLGFCLRPGFGEARDSQRTNLTRKLYQAGLAFPDDLQNQINWLVLWRRTAGGLSAAHQHEIRNYLGGIGIGRKKSGTRLNAQLECDGWRLLASLEHLSGATRAALGGELLSKLKKEPADSAWLWSLGRFGARIPLYGSLSCVVPTETAEEWISTLLDLRDLTPETARAMVQLGRLTEDRSRDISREVRKRAVERLRTEGGIDESMLRALVEFVVPGRSDVSLTFGESLPKGLHLESTAECLSPVSAIATDD